MNLNAIVYTSNTGYTRQYAVLLGEKTGLPVYSLEEAASRTTHCLPTCPSLRCRVALILTACMEFINS